MKRKLLLGLAVSLLYTVGAWAQTDVTSTYLTNADFSSTDGWTQTHSEQYWALGNGLIGTYCVANSYTSTTDETHLGTEYCLGIQCRWNTNFAAFQQTKENASLPVGTYTLTFDVQNTNTATASGANYENLFYVKVGEDTYNDNLMEWKSSSPSWTTHTISFFIEEEATADITFSFGYKLNTNNGTGATPHLYVSHLKLIHQSLLDGAKSLWKTAYDAAVATMADDNYANVGGEEKENLEAEIVKDEPSTKEAYDAATTALNEAVANFKAAKDSYDALVAAKAIEVPELAYATVEKKSDLSEAMTATATSGEDAAAKTAAIMTALRAYYESHAMAEAVDDAVDMTDRIANATDPTNNDGWTWTGNKNNPASNEPWTDADGTDVHSYFDGGNWGANSWTTTMKQDVNIPAGKYLLTAKARAAANVTFTMEAGGQSVELPHVGNVGNIFNRGWGDVSVEFEAEGDPITILVTASSETLHEWFSVSNFRLVQLEKVDIPMADEDDFANLANLIQNTEATYELGFGIGQYAPYNNVEALTALAAAKAIDPESEAGYTKEFVKKAYHALDDASWTENTEDVDAIYDGQFANTEANATSGDINLPGWTKVVGIRLLVKDESVDPGLAYTDGKAAVFSWGGTTITYGEQTGYTLPLNKYSIYELSLKVSGWRDGDLPNWVSVSLDEETQSVDAKALGAKAINIDEGNPFATLKFYLTPTADNSVLKIYGNKHFTVADLSLKQAVATDIELDEAVDYTPEAAYANVTLKRTIKTGYNTVVLPFNLDEAQTAEVFGDGAQVYTYREEADGEQSTIYFDKKDEAVIVANQPVLVKATADATEKTIEGVVVSDASVQNVTGTNFDFVGSYSGLSLEDGDYFFNGDKLYRSNGVGNAMKGFRAYLQSKTANAEARLVIGDMETGIEAVNSGDVVADKAIYTLSGQRVSKAQRGLYIVSGKVIVVK